MEIRCGLYYFLKRFILILSVMCKVSVKLYVFKNWEFLLFVDDVYIIFVYLVIYYVV